MMPQAKVPSALTRIVLATGEEPRFQLGEPVRVMTRAPVGHYRVPQYLRGKTGIVTAAVEPAAVDNEEEAYGRNAGSRRHYYRVSFPMTDIWPGYADSAIDVLQIDVFETWLERA